MLEVIQIVNSYRLWSLNTNRNFLNYGVEFFITQKLSRLVEIIQNDLKSYCIYEAVIAKDVQKEISNEFRT